MQNKRTRKLRGFAQPVLPREPLLLRLCNGFVNNLELILKTALVIGSIVLVQDLRTLFDDFDAPDTVPVQAAPAELAPVNGDVIEEPVLTEGVKQALNCTYQDYRNAHYDECVDEPSEFYNSPHADPDDAGHVSYDSPVLYAQNSADTGSDEFPASLLH
ncbi:MAG: hypothetical protein WBM76_02130 [Woeseiaceae bacterium]